MPDDAKRQATGPNLAVLSETPLNAEPNLERLRESFITEVRDFYIRSHGDVPDIDEATHTVAVRGKVNTPLELSMRDLRSRFRPKTLTAVMQCAGNRRGDLQDVEPTSGDPWSAAAIGNAQWTGVPLADVLRAAGAKDAPGLHVAFEAVDVARNDGAPDALFGVSIPMVKAMSGDTLVAWAMNGEPLTKEHGAPIRVVVPGYAGVRSPKWLKSITVQDKPSNAFQQRMDYRLFPPQVHDPHADPSRGETISDMPVNSAICEPLDGDALPAGKIEVKGSSHISNAS